ncbi:competence type IV pilus assembly protein ComGB [Falsibacillus pallidus]|uniref:competence type IV pilus assembly protein ComGB n=1 Tax=Falsibacillus pallidus TaxID=493781 RepID=UPI003D956450
MQQGELFLLLSDLLQHGFTLVEALSFLARLHENWKISIENVVGSLFEGGTFNDSLFKNGFDPTACTQIFLAEKNGNLEHALKHLGDYMIQRETDKRKVMQLLQYPLVLFIILLGIIMIMKTLLFPRFFSLYASMGFTPSKGMALYLNTLNNMPLYLIIFLISMFFIFAIFHLITKKWSALKKAEFISRIPLLGIQAVLMNSYFFSREWGFLLASGHSVQQGLTILKEQDFHPWLKEVSERIHEQLQSGKTFSESLSGFRFLNHDLSLIVLHGEKSGQLSQELLFYSQHCLSSGKKSLETWLKLIQPSTFIIIAVFIISIYLSIMLPMFKAMETI